MKEISKMEDLYFVTSKSFVNRYPSLKKTTEVAAVKKARQCVDMSHETHYVFKLVQVVESSASAPEQRDQADQGNGADPQNGASDSDDCPICDGRGWDYPKEQIEIPCVACDGTGKRPK
jgi:hypothetical protein